MDSDTGCKQVTTTTTHNLLSVLTIIILGSGWLGAVHSEKTQSGRDDTPGPPTTSYYLPARNESSVSSLHAQLRASSTLRDNIVNTVGYLLNTQGVGLDRDQYTSLTMLYHAIRLRHVRTLPLLSQLKKIATQPPAAQCVVLLQEMQKFAPRYLETAISIAIESVKYNHAKVDEVLRAMRASVKFGDFLADIDKSQLNLLQKPITFNKQFVEKHTVELMGQEFAQIFGALANNEIALTPFLFSEIMLHLPMDTVAPQANEMMRLLVESLRDYDSDVWEDMVSRIPATTKKDPVSLVRFVLKLMNGVDDAQIRNPSLYILPHIKEPTATFAHRTYDTLSTFINKRLIDVTSHLMAISSPEYPEEVVNLRKRLTYFLDHEWLDQDRLLKGFVKYDFVNPIDFVIAILTRMSSRLTELPYDIIWAIKTITSYLVFKKISWEKPSHLPIGPVDLPLLTDAFVNSYTPPRMRQLIHNVLAPALTWDSSVLTPLLHETPVSECNRPKKCLVTLLSKALEKEALKSRHVVDAAEAFLNSVDDEGNPLMDDQNKDMAVPEQQTDKPEDGPEGEENNSLEETTDGYDTPSTVISTNTDNPISHLQHYQNPKTWDPFESQLPAQTRGKTGQQYKHFPMQNQGESKGQGRGKNFTNINMQHFQNSHEGSGASEKGKSSSLWGSKTGHGAVPHDNKHQIIPGKFGRPHNSVHQRKPKHYEIKYAPKSYENGARRNMPGYPMPGYPMQMTGYNQRSIGSYPGAPMPQGYAQPGYGLPPYGQQPRANNPYSQPIYPHRGVMQYPPPQPYGPSLTYNNQPYQQYPPPQQQQQQQQYQPAPPRAQSYGYQPQQPPRSPAPQITHPSTEQRPRYQPPGGTEYHPAPYSTDPMAQPWQEEIKRLIESLPNNMRSMPLPLPDQQSENLPTQQDFNFEYLLPSTMPGTPEHLRIAPLRVLLSTQNLLQQLGHDFRADAFPFRGILLREILKQVLKKNVIQNDFFNADIKTYLEQLENAATKPRIEVNWESLIGVLPFPMTEEENKKYSEIKEFLKPSLTDILGPTFNPNAYKKKGVLLKNVLQQVTTIKSVQDDKKLLDAVRYYLEKVTMNDEGSQPVEYVIVQQVIISKTVNLNALFRAFDRDNFNKTADAAFRNLVEFFSNDFKPEVHFNKFEFTKYSTKGEWLREFFKFLIKKNLVKPATRSDIEVLLPLIRQSGPGSEPVEYVEN